LGEVVDFTTETETRYQDNFSIEVLAIKRAYRLNELKELEYYYEDEKLQTINLNQHSRTIQNDFGKQVNEITEAFNKVCNRLSSYDIKEFLKIADIKLK